MFRELRDESPNVGVGLVGDQGAGITERGHSPESAFPVSPKRAGCDFGAPTQPEALLFILARMFCSEPCAAAGAPEPCGRRRKATSIRHLAAGTGRHRQVVRHSECAMNSAWKWVASEARAIADIHNEARAGNRRDAARPALLPR